MIDPDTGDEIPEEIVELFTRTCSCVTGPATAAINISTAFTMLNISGVCEEAIIQGVLWALCNRAHKFGNMPKIVAALELYSKPEVASENPHKFLEIVRGAGGGSDQKH